MLRRKCLHVSEEFRFEAGGSLPEMDIVYHCSPREYRSGEKVVWVCHALTGNSNPEDWWPGMVGEGKMFDPENYYIVCVSMIGSPYGACCPATINPSTGKPYLLDFPRTTVRDMVRAGILVRKHLGIDKIDLMLGPSIGGFQATEWVIMEPDVVKKAVFLATASRCAPYVTAFNESQRLALLADPTFLEAKSIEGGRAGLKCARTIALISYRSFMGYNLTQSECDDDVLFADRASSYQRYQGEKLLNRGFDAYSYYYLTYALDSMNVGRGRGGMPAALSTIKAECTVIAITSDSLFPPEHSRKTASELGRAKYYEIESLYGHDGFLIENDQLEAILQPVAESL